MAVSCKSNGLQSRLKPFLSLQRFNHLLGKNIGVSQFHTDMGSDSMMKQGQIDMSKWRTVDSRTLGITRSMISESSWIVLKVLHSAGFEAYLVGGCVRDLLLRKIPKDFDVITTARLAEIKKEFRRCLIVGTRFPICLVHVKGSAVEVSSFETVAKLDIEKNLLLKRPRGCDKKDFLLWRNSMRRDFTVNSLFFDPFVRKIYDYANGLMDLRSLQLRTLIPAQLSFEEDRARIFRGLRLAARLGLSFSEETEIAVRRLVPSIASLNKSRVMMEMNYMLSYGASVSSLSLLHRFKLLEVLLPLQAAYLSQQYQSQRSSVMLMKLFSNLDKLVSSDRPSHCILWLGILVFHLALVSNPQDALVVWIFASVLCFRNWDKGVQFGREHAVSPTHFVPEITEANQNMSDDELAERVSQLASAVQQCACSLSGSDSLLQMMARFPDSPCSGFVFVTKGTQKRTSDIFKVLAYDVIKTHQKTRSCLDIHWHLFKKGNVDETGFVLGKIIIDTLKPGTIQNSEEAEERPEHPLKSNSGEEIEDLGNVNKKRSLPLSNGELQKSAKKKKMKDLQKIDNIELDKPAKLKLEMIGKNKEDIRCGLNFFREEQDPIAQNENLLDRHETKLKIEVVDAVEMSRPPLEGKKERETLSENSRGAEGKIERPKKDVKGEKHKGPSLSSLFQ